jgi:hypothetical protein
MILKSLRAFNIAEMCSGIDCTVCHGGGFKRLFRTFLRNFICVSCQSEKLKKCSGEICLVQEVHVQCLY